MSVGQATDILDSYEPNHLYKHEFGNNRGAYFTIVQQDDSGFELNLSQKISLKVAYIQDAATINGIEVVKLRDGKRIEAIRLSLKNLEQLCRIVSFLETLNFEDIKGRRTKLIIDDGKISPSFTQLKNILLEGQGSEIISQLLSDGYISSHDIVNTGYRRKQLEVFDRLLNEENYYKEYGSLVGLKDPKEEKIWQHFFETNQWIFGYGMDYKFKSILQREAHISETDLDGSNSVITDFLIGDRFFTTFVEIKRPSTKIFGSRKNRSNCWTLSDDLICAVSQILEHKAAGQIKFDKPQFINGELMTQKAYDSKVILLIGHWGELDDTSNTQVREIKKKTFELYRRDSRNIEMLTYDELYERAKFIVEGQINQLEISENAVEECDELPF
jgi:hypothetical protein